jgi:deoxyribonuclease-4
MSKSFNRPTSALSSVIFRQENPLLDVFITYKFLLMPSSPKKSLRKVSATLRGKSKPARVSSPTARVISAAKAKAPKADLPLVIPKGVLLGAHTSTAGGVAQAIVRAHNCGFTAAQIFVKNNKQWFAPPLAEADIAQFRKAQKASGIYFFAHNSYLVNLASQDAQMFSTSVRAMTAEVERAEALGLPFIVMHPGSHGGAGEEAGLKRITAGLDKITTSTKGYRCKMALEVTAGQGTALGYRLEHLAQLMDCVQDETRFGICLDTAHLFAAGYNIGTHAGYQGTFGQVEKLFGVRRLLGLHLNDSKVPLGKRVDRHAHLGEGEIGLDCFRWLMEDPRWARTPKVLETPKSEDMHEDVDNLKKLAPYLQAIA